MPKRLRSKRWCFTLNNPTVVEKEFIQLSMEELKNGESGSLKLTYLITGKEVVSTEHLQGYCEVETKASLSSMKSFLKRAHWEKAKGSPKQASEYCKKDGDFEEAGVLSVGQGFRSDLNDIKDLIVEGKNEEFIADNFFSKWVVYRKSFQAYAALKNQERSWSTQVHVFWGKTGTGKTRFVMDQVMDSDFWSPGDYKWFDGYCGQPIVIIDDFRGEYQLQMLLKLLDRYPMSVPVKGGFTKWAPKKVYITSNIHPDSWYPLADRYSIAAMFRRFTIVQSCFESIY